MPGPFKLSVTNKSGSQRSYAVFCHPPKISGDAGKVWSHVIYTVNISSGDDAELTLPRDYNAICGTSMGRPGAGVTMMVSSAKAVTLGKTDNGISTNGTTILFTVMHGAPMFSHETTQHTDTNAFSIKTSGTFTRNDASNRNLLIGYGPRSDEDISAAASFVPQPNDTYQIQPSNVYYLTAGHYQQGEFIDAENVNNAVKIDFDQLGKTNAKIVDDHRGQLVLERN